jgi:hypothetical protein
MWRTFTRHWGAIGGTRMRNRIVSDNGPDLLARLQEQDEKFCNTLRAAINKGREFCPTVVITAPGTQRPIVGYARPD